MRVILVATTLASISVMTATMPSQARPWQYHDQYSDRSYVRITQSVDGKRRVKKKRSRAHHSRRHVAPSRNGMAEIGKLRRELMAYKLELDGIKARLAPLSAAVASSPRALAGYALMPMPDLRAMPSGPPQAEPVTPRTASLPIALPAPHVPEPAPTDHSRLAIGAGRGVDRRLIAILHEASRHLPEGYTARIEAGKQPRRRGGYHPRGLAADVRLFDHGKPLPWYQTVRTFRIYERFAQDAKRAQMKLHPGGPGFVWGGYFSNGFRGTPFMPYGFADLMHMQLGGPMGGGSWAYGATGATRKWLVAGGGESVGMAKTADSVVAQAQSRRKPPRRREARAQ